MWFIYLLWRFLGTRLYSRGIKPWNSYAGTKGIVTVFSFSYICSCCLKLISGFILHSSEYYKKEMSCWSEHNELSLHNYIFSEDSSQSTACWNHKKRQNKGRRQSFRTIASEWWKATCWTYNACRPWKEWCWKGSFFPFLDSFWFLLAWFISKLF